jgi:uncharacterized LabA/DUF88 family protein
MRAAIFIDGAYLQKQMQTARVSPNYADLADYLLGPLRSKIPVDLLRCYFYHCPPWMSSSPTQDETRRMELHDEFAAGIEELSRWQLRLGKLERRRDGDREYFEQKRVDVLLSCDLVRHSAAGHIQHAILVAGDSDLIPAVDAAQESGVTLTLWCAKDNTVHKDLKKISDDVHVLDWKEFPTSGKARKKSQKKSVQRRRTSSKRSPATGANTKSETKSEMKPAAKTADKPTAKKTTKKRTLRKRRSKSTSRQKKKPES